MNLIKMALEEEPLEDEKKERARIAVCESGCVRFNAEKRKCRGCGCYVDIKAKMAKHRNPNKNMRVEITHCPDAKWPGDEIKIVNHYRTIDGLDLIK